MNGSHNCNHAKKEMLHGDEMSRLSKWMTEVSDSGKDI